MDGDGFQRRNREWLLEVDVDCAADDVDDGVDLGVRRVGDRQLFFGQVGEPGSVVVGSARVAVVGFAGEGERLHAHAFIVAQRFHAIEARLGDDLALEQGVDELGQVVRRGDDCPGTEEHAGMGFGHRLPVAGDVNVGQGFVFAHVDGAGREVCVFQPDFGCDSFREIVRIRFAGEFFEDQA